MLNPALKGNMNVLRSCTKLLSVKRVVMTSSCSAVRYDYNRSQEDPPLNESAWSNPEYCRDYKVLFMILTLNVHGLELCV
jgi:nucleoside-diphosphate-sugar epimerase